MGRLAGMTLKDIERLTWKSRVAEAREDKIRWTRPRIGPPPAELLADPAAARRRSAILWWLGKSCMALRICERNCPPLTPDMRKLIARGLAVLERRPAKPAFAPTMHTHRITYLVITEAGRSELARTTLCESEIRYIHTAFARGNLR